MVKQLFPTKPSDVFDDAEGLGRPGGARALRDGCSKSGTTNKWRPLPAVNLMGRYMVCLREKLDVRKLANDLHS